MLLQRLATGATGVKQARYRQGPLPVYTGAARHSYAHAQYIHSHCVYGRSLALAVQCETMHGVYEFRRGFCTLVLSLTYFWLCQCTIYNIGAKKRDLYMQLSFPPSLLVITVDTSLPLFLYIFRYAACGDRTRNAPLRRYSTNL